MKKIFLFLTFLLCQTFSFGQIITLKNEEFTKVVAVIDEKVPPMKYLGPENLSGKRKWFIDTPLERKFRSGEMDKDELANYYKKLALSYYSNPDSVQISDTLSLFYLWSKDGVFQIITREEKAKIKIQKKIKFKKAINKSLKKSLNKLKRINSDIFFLGKIQNGKDANYSLKEAYFFNSNLSVFIEKNEEVIYKVININFYNFTDKPVIKDLMIYNLLKPEFHLSIFQILPSDSSQFELFPDDKYKLEGLHKELFGFSDYSHKKYLRDDAFDSPNNRQSSFNNYKLPVASSMSEQEKIGIPNFQSFDSIISPDFDLKLSLNYKCPGFYEVYNTKLSTERAGILVIPNKFFLSQRLKILSVDDKPWEEFKTDLCK